MNDTPNGTTTSTNGAVADPHAPQLSALAPPPAGPDRKVLPKLYAALAKAQGQIENAEMNASNPGFKRGEIAAKYADLASVMNAIRKPLAEHGLCLLHFVKADANGVTVTARLAHESGEYVEDALWLPVSAKTPQGYGSSITYGRRYTAAALTGLAQEDDDAMGGGLAATTAPPPPKDTRAPARSTTAAPKPKPAGPDEKAATESTLKSNEEERARNNGEPTELDKLCAHLKECETVEQVDQLAMKNAGFAAGNPTVQTAVRKFFQDRRAELGGAKK